MESAGAIEISDDEDIPLSANKSVQSEAGGKVNGSHMIHGSDADPIHSSEEYDYTAPENEIDLNDVSLHESDLEDQDIFADNLKRFTGKCQRHQELSQ